VDEGFPIAYQVLEKDVPVYASGGESVGTVDHVVSAPEKDIFHGIVMKAGKSRHFVAADQIESLHERGVDLKIDEAEAAALPEPHGGAMTFHDSEPGIKGPSSWKHFTHLMEGHASRDRWQQDK